MFIGEAPGADEDKQGKPFVGAAGIMVEMFVAALALFVQFQRRREFTHQAALQLLAIPGVVHMLNRHGFAKRVLPGPHVHYPRLHDQPAALAVVCLASPAAGQEALTDAVNYLLNNQAEDGSWSGEDQGSGYGAAYATAINALFLAIPDGMLPIFQR